METLLTLQQQIHGTLARGLTAYATTRDLGMLATILPLGILFGAIHALTPGHGKTVLSSYLLGSRLALVRSLRVAGVLTATHVGSAVVLALIAAPLVSRALGSAGRAPILEDLSRGLLALIGLWLLIRAIRGQAHRHHEGIMVGVVAGLVPCPLTLFAMFLALGRGVPEAGLTFALSMMVGVGLTLAGVAMCTILARDQVAVLLAKHGASVERLSRILEVLTGAPLFAIGLGEFLSR